MPGAVRQAFVHMLLAAAMMLTGAALPGMALADKSDRDKPVNIEADRLTMDDVKKESVFEGNVTVSQGTLTLKADKVIVRQDAGGFNYAFAFGKPAYFKQKREGYDEYIEGNADRLEYDGKADKMQMFANAEIHKGNDEVKGDYIAYDAVTEFYQVIGDPSAKTVLNPKGRVHATIQPPKKAADKPGSNPPGNTGSSAQPLPLRSSSSLRNKLEE
jgi:lipopolysaccharide export system protein LptA